MRIALLACILAPFTALAGDWPAWRYDASRSASSPTELPLELQRHWSLSLPPLQPAWRDQAMMAFDVSYEPIVAGQTMFLASARQDSVTAYDTRTGSERWHFLCDGPVRFAPIFQGGKLYFSSDDGHLYCLNGESGQLLWKFRGGPSDRRLLGNERLISSWPARGAPIVADGVVYFAASIWPFMGTFIHALDAESGRVIWTTDGDGSTYIKQPHSADAFAGVAPQGPLGISGDHLIIPGGRSVPAIYDRKTGKLIHYLLNDNSKKGGGHEVTVAGEVFFNGPGAFKVSDGKYLGEFTTPVIGGSEQIFGYQLGEVRSFDLKGAPLTDPDKKVPRWKAEQLGAGKFSGLTTMIRAGDRLYLGSKGKVAAIALPLPKEGKLTPVWEMAVEGTPQSLVAADDRLFVSTREGEVLCFASGEAPAVKKPVPVEEAERVASPLVRPLLEQSKIQEGYMVVWSADLSLLRPLIDSTRCQVIAIDPSEAKVAAAREALIASKLYGVRCSVHVGTPSRFPLPAYLASVMVAPQSLNDTEIRKLFGCLRPYGGTLFLTQPDRDVESLREVVKAFPNAKVQESKAGLMLTSEGAIPGSADWTHEHADAANTRVSRDKVVKAPLGLLWFGGTTNEGILPRHGHGPQPQVAGGRIIIEGMDKLRAVDVYTGRLLWEAPFPGLGSFYDNLAHQPGANSAGTNFITLPDAIYVAYQNKCVRVDPATGKPVGEFQLPALPDGTRPRWGFISVAGDYLIGGADPLFDAQLEKQLKSPSKLIKFGENDNFSASRKLTVMDRHTGQVHWNAEAKMAFRHNAICVGNNKLFAIDRLSGRQRSLIDDTEKANAPKPRLVAFDMKNGQQLWEGKAEVFGTWLSYSEKHDILIETGRITRDSMLDEPKGMRGYRGKDGRELWFDKSALGPAMLRGDTVLRGQGACDIQTGKPILIEDPISGEPEEWLWSRTYGCNTPAASENLLTFRSGAAGFYDLCSEAGTGNFGGFRSSCTLNLIVADGVLSAPDYTRTCTCSYQNQTSLALVPMPEAEEWTFYGKGDPKKLVKRVGINLGAPGDRRSTDGTLWLESPSVGGLSPTVPVHVTGSKMSYFRRHPTKFQGPLSWVGSSGAVGIESAAIQLLPSEEEDRYYTVRLYFSEPEEVKPGERVFSVNLQGRKVLDHFDIVKEAGQPYRSLVKEFHAIRVEDELRLSFRPLAGSKGAILCGVEVIEETVSKGNEVSEGAKTPARLNP
jgi:outer membrane protein assembly factor BamB